MTRNFNYHANTVSEGRGECEQDIHSGIQPLGPPFVVALSFIERLNLSTKNGENGTGRVA
jgi:hypothetical protein